MASTLSAEFRLAVACCVRPPATSAQAELQLSLLANIDWPHFNAIVQRHRIAGLVYANLQPHAKSIPAPALQLLASAARQQTLASLARLAEAHSLVAQFESANIPVAILKGSPLAILAFGDISLRQSKDIDLLIAPEHIPAAAALLEGNSYIRTLPHPAWSTEAHHITWLRLGKNFEYAHTTTGHPIDLHWRLTNNPYLAPANFQPEALQHVGISPAISLPTLLADDLLLYLCVHGSMHAWFRLKWLADVAALLQQSPPDVIPHLLARASTLGLDRPVHLTLALCNRLFNTPLPPGFHLDRPTRVLLRHALDALAAGDIYTRPFGTTRLYLANYLLKPDRRYRSEQLLIDFTRGSIPPSKLPLPLQIFPRAASWLSRKLRSGGKA